MSRLEDLRAVLFDAGTPPLMINSAIEDIERVFRGDKNPPVVKEPNYFIERDNGSWFCSEWHRKDKYSEPTRHRVLIHDKDVQDLWLIICSYWRVPLYPLAESPAKIKPGFKWDLPQMARHLIEALGLKIPIASFNGGNFRGIYLKHYVYPSRVLDFEKKIRFGNVSWRLK